MAISNITSLSIMDDNIKRTFIILERTNMDIITIISVGNALGMYKIKLSINSLWKLSKTELRNARNRNIFKALLC